MKMELSEKQKEFWNNCNARWNIKSGAVRSGKTHLDYYLIPRRIRECTGSGLIVILGNTQGTLERNILDPMRNIFGSKLVSHISSDNKVRLFGRQAYALGADKKSQVERIQGAGIEYCYGDEVTTWAEEVFQMLKSRLDKENSKFDGTCNPDNPNHWLKAFLDSDVDLYHQHYTLDDNPFLPQKFKDELKKEYTGTIYYNRFILGQWMRAEGAIYRLFADHPERYLISRKQAKEKKYIYINVGVDFGGNKSKHAFVATGITTDYEVVVLVSERHQADTDPNELCRLYCDFIERVISMYGSIDLSFADSAEQVLIRGLRKGSEERKLYYTIKNSLKTEIVDRIRLVSGLMARYKFFYTEDATTVKEALMCAVWDESKNKDTRLDDGSSDIDTLDALEYSIEKYTKRLLQI